MILAALVLPIYAIGYEWRHSENCTPDLPVAAFIETRNIALITWGATLIGVGVGIWISLYLLDSSGKIIWWAFGSWKVISLSYALVVTPGCFESYNYLAERGHPLEAPLGFLTLLSWVALLAVIIFHAVKSRGTFTPFA